MPVEQSVLLAKSNRKLRAKKNVAIANAQVPGAAPAPKTVTQSSSRIAPTFVQVTTAQMLRRQDEAKGFRVATSKAQNRKETGMPRKGNAISQAGTTEVTVIQFGGLENRDEEASLLCQHPSSFVEASDFPARLGLKAGSTAQLWEASGLYNLKPEPVSKASEGLGLLRPASPGFTGFTGLITTNIMV